MRIPLLPELDLARIAPRSSDQKRVALEAFRLSHPPYRYVPFRKSLSDILNVPAGFLPPGPRVPFDRIDQSIRAESWSDREYDANLRVALSLYDHSLVKAVEARAHPFFPLVLGGGTKIAYWHSIVLSQGDKPVVPFFDPRRTSTRLTEVARRFVFSVMHERIRVADPDFGQTELRIVQFTAPEKGPRRVVSHSDDGVVLYSFEDLDAMVQETYEIWTEVYLERTERARRRSA